MIVAAALIARPGAGIAYQIDAAGGRRQEEEPRRQDYRQTCQAGLLPEGGMHGGPLYLSVALNAPQIKAGERCRPRLICRWPKLSKLRAI
jgi:hypothetical protein